MKSVLQPCVRHHPDEVQLNFDRATAQQEGEQMALSISVYNLSNTCGLPHWVKGDAVCCQCVPGIFHNSGLLKCGT